VIKFNYKAKNQEGKQVAGRVEARDEKQAIALLRERGLVPFSLNPIRTGLFGLSSKLFQRITLSDLTSFTQQLSQMISAGLTVNEALRILTEQSSPALGKVIEDIIRSVEGGTSLAEALEKHPRVFSTVYVSLVRAGETAGVLDEVLQRLASNLEKQREFTGKVKGAMIYPIIIVIGMLIVGSIMMIFVIPKLFSLYEEFEAELPAPTKMLVSISGFLASFWWLVILAFVGAIFLFRNYKRTESGRMQIDTLVLQLPIIGNIKTQIVLTEMTRTLGLLVGAGISIIEALNISAEAAGNALFEKHLKEAAKQVEKGLPLAGTLEVYEEFPPIVPHMISVGEQTGKVDEVLTKLSRYFEVQSEEMVKGLTTVVEPLIMVILGVGVGFLIISVILPIYNLTTQF